MSEENDFTLAYRMSKARFCWGRMRTLRVFTVDDLKGDQIPRRFAKEFVARTVKAGLVGVKSQADKSGGIGKTRPAVYELLRDVGRRCPRFRSGKLDETPTPKERMWAAIKPLRGGFTVQELTALARVHYAAAARYIALLHKHGYIDRLSRYAGGSVPVDARYSVKKGMHSGPDAPQELRSGAIWDPNRQALLTEAQE